MVTISIPYWFFFIVGGMFFIGTVASMIGDFLKWRYAKIMKQMQEDKEK